MKLEDSSPRVKRGCGQIKIIILGGFTGAGKTSLLLPLARFITGEAEPGSPPLVIIENEIGEVGIDDKVIEAEGFSVRGLFAGCICCQLSGQLTVCLNEIGRTINPMWVIIETTGVAVPGNIVDTIARYGNRVDGILSVAVVDALRWVELQEMLPGLIERQVAGADYILVNKVDLMKPAELELVEKSLRKIKAIALCRFVSAGNGVDNAIWRELVSTV